MGARQLIKTGFELFFVDGPVGMPTGGGEQQVVTVREVGKLALPTGRLVAADPFVLWPEDAEAFTATFEPGAYPVSVSLVSWQDKDGLPDVRQGYRVAAAKLTVQDEPAYMWEPAVVPGEHLPPMLSGQSLGSFGYGVESSTGAFFDLAAAPAARPPRQRRRRRQLRTDRRTGRRGRRPWPGQRHRPRVRTERRGVLHRLGRRHLPDLGRPQRRR